MVRPAYLRLSRGELQRRAEEAVAALANCRLCPRDCGVDRARGKWAACKTGRYAHVSSAFPHFGEEDCLRGWKGSGTIFFGHCNLRCVFCMAPATRIATDRGQMSIRELFERGEPEGRPQVRWLDGSVNVPTLDGGWAPVSKAFRHAHRGELLRVKPFDVPAVLVTPDHPFLVVRRDDPKSLGEVAARELGAEHRLVIPVRSPGAAPVRLCMPELFEAEHDHFVKSEQRRVPERELATLFASGATSERLGELTGYHPPYVRKLRGEWRRGHLTTEGEARLARQGFVVEGATIRFKTEKRPGIPVELTVDGELAWLLGIYCAEGHVTSERRRPNSHRLVFTVGPHEADVAAHIATCLERTFGVEPSVVRRRTTLAVEVGKTSLALLFKLLCGPQARSKRVPVAILQSPASVIASYLDGVMCGDGWDSGSHHVVNTVSAELAHGLFEAGLLLGNLPSFHRWEPAGEKEIEGRRVTQSPLYRVKFPQVDLETGGYRSRWPRSAHGYLVPVRSVERVPYDGDVYNLEIDHPEHAYLAPFMAVGNCQNFDISQAIRPGEAEDGLVPEEIADLMLRLQALGCHNINFVTPEHVVPQVLEALVPAVERGLSLPIVYNTSAYDSLESLRWLDGVVDIYMPDFKLWSADACRTYLKAEDYAEAARSAIREMHRQAGPLVVDGDGLARRGLIIRHLVMPGMLDETRSILEWIASELGCDTYVNLMDQYYPAGKVSADSYAEINRHLDGAELAAARRIARELGLNRLDERAPHARLRARLRVLA